MFGRTEEKSWLEEELERERKGICVGETWWEKVWRCVRDIFGKRELETLLVTLDDNIIAIPTCDGPDSVDLINHLVRDGALTMNEARVAMGLSPVYSDESVILYADDRPVVEMTRRL